MQPEVQPVSGATYQELIQRIHILENDVKEKEALISQKDYLLRQIHSDQGLKTCPSDSPRMTGPARDPSMDNYSICGNLQPFSMRLMKRRVPVEVSKGNAFFYHVFLCIYVCYQSYIMHKIVFLTTIFGGLFAIDIL